MTKFGVLGSGEVGQALARGLKAEGYEVRIGSRSPEKLAAFATEAGVGTGTFAEVARWGDALVLAVKGLGAEAVLREAGAGARGKVVLDTTNPIADEPPDDGVLHYFTGPNTSLMEQLQAKFPDVRLVKAFNSVGSDLMVHPRMRGGVTPTMFYCGNDAEAKALTARVIGQLGWEGSDMGTAAGARAVEALCQLWCIPGFRENRWTHAFHLVEA
jgi:8-hydroxy-5-deazaflavin:NADPH oxidoreductase